MNWELKTFEELSNTALYKILQLRCEVFVVEQNCPYLDEDDKDQECYHFMCWKDGLLAAYTRILPAGLAFEEASIGRVVTSAKARGEGLGRSLMLESIKALYQLYGEVPIKIGAQLYLRDFYLSLGFLQVSDSYLEDNIPHIKMLKTIATDNL
ncbi:MAG: GNAT family N-acetyltransferase [Bacteroidota bacterium]